MTEFEPTPKMRDELTPRLIRTLKAMYDYGSAYGGFPTSAELGQGLDVTYATARKYVRALKKAGYLTAEGWPAVHEYDPAKVEVVIGDASEIHGLDEERSLSITREQHRKEGSECLRVAVRMLHDRLKLDLRELYSLLSFELVVSSSSTADVLRGCTEACQKTATMAELVSCYRAELRELVEADGLDPESFDL